MKKTATRVIAIALVLLMALALVPMGARAEGAYSVSFNSRSKIARGEMLPVSFNEDGTVVLPRCAFHAPGYQFQHWIDETDRVYADGCTISAEDAGLSEANPVLVLRAVWEKQNPVVVTLDANGGEGTNSTSVKYDSLYTVPACSFTRTNYTFAGWRGSDGESYSAGDELPLTEDFTFFAQWTQNTVSVNFAGNGGTGSMAPVSHPAGNDFTVPACGFTAPEGEQFDGWLGADDQSYAPEDVISGLAGNFTLIAQWADVPSTTYTLSFDANGGTGSTAAITNTTGSFTLPACGFTKSGYTFLGWSVDRVAESEASLKQANDTYTLPAGHTEDTLYAQWAMTQPVGATRTVHFNANGGDGVMEDRSAPEGTAIKAPACTFTAPAGKHFVNWNTESNGSGTSYSVGSTIGFNGEFNETTLFAQWSAETVLVTVYVNDYGAVLYNGSTVDRNINVPKGSTSAFTFEPQSGCRIKSVKLNGVDVTGQSTLNFTANSTLSVVFQKGLDSSCFTAVPTMGATTTSNGTVVTIYDISLMLSASAPAGTNLNYVYPLTPVSFLLPYPKSSMNAGNYTYTLKHVPDDEPVLVQATDRGLAGSSINFSEFSMTAVPRSNALTGDVEISGTPIIGNTLSASVPADSTNNTGTLTYTWKRGGTEIATGQTYTLIAADKGATLICEVTSSVQSGKIQSAPVYPSDKPNPVVKSYIYFGDKTKTGEIGNVSRDMEYATDVKGPWFHLTGNTLTGLTTPGTYYFRLENNHDAMGSVVVKAFSWITAGTIYGKGSVTPSTSTVENGSNLVLEFTPRKNYQVAEVRVNGTRVPNMRNARYLNLKNINGRAAIEVGFYYTGRTPHTGDDSNLPLWSGLAALSLTFLGAAIVLLKRKRSA